MRYVTAFTLGTIAAVIVMTALLLGLSVVASAAGAVDVDIGLGPVRVARVLREQGATETSMGPGALVLAAAIGLANAVVLEIVRRRAAARTRSETGAP